MSDPGPSADIESMVSNASPTRVFLAEDSLPIRQRVGALLAAEGMHIAGEAGTARGCIDAILACRPDVVVLDVHLEGGSGLQVLKAVRAVDPRVEFVVLSNNADPAYRSRYLAAGAVRFLDKCIEFDQLARAVQSARHAPIH